MNVFKATSVEIMSVPPLIVWFLSTVEYELVLLGEDLDWLSCLQGVLSIEYDHWTSIYNNEWHYFPLILPGTYQTSIICERYFIQAAKNRVFYGWFFCMLMEPVFDQTWYFDHLDLFPHQCAMGMSEIWKD